MAQEGGDDRSVFHMECESTAGGTRIMLRIVRYDTRTAMEDAKDLLEELKGSCRYVIEPKLTFFALAEQAKDNKFKREDLKKAFNNIETSDKIFNDLFADVDLYSSRLGINDTKQSETVAELLKVINKADILHTAGDVLGNAYEYLIGEFASETGKKAGEFYTPAGPAEILTRIAIMGQEEKRGLLVYDPCCGSASMLLDARKFTSQPAYVKYFGQELMMQREYREDGQQHVLRERCDPVLNAFIGADSAPLTKFKARSQMIAELEEMIVEEVLPLQIGVNY